MSKAVREATEKAEKLIAKHETELEPGVLAELRLSQKTVTSLIEEHRSLKTSIKETAELLEASAKDLGKVVRRAKRALDAADKARKAAKLAEKVVSRTRKGEEGGAGTAADKKGAATTATKQTAPKNGTAP